MKIDCVSDTHGLVDIHALLKHSDADMVIVAGDVSNSEASFQAFYASLYMLPHKHKVLIAGNHDAALKYMKHCVDIHGITYLYNETKTIGGIRIAGSPYTLPFCDWNFMAEEAELATIFNNIGNDVDILVTHGPAFGILDQTVAGIFAGSKELKTAVFNTIRPKVHLFGHIHEQYGHITVDGIEFYNVSLLDSRYRHKNKVTTIEINIDNN